ncbi:mandelate racemase/muconate lactonizing enzyme family protein [Conexibacter stalactiti]|uniref:Mandelate racemase/muconate lactonizing enzyme family protein n=1 Tax=Conexibacter stalactiti TaxID=1940611 RepID=A0ABU4HYL9_9ACTN|nr:mandelate racemase/muconate lactonizing enzyme family protein [Conexibacter stalactiti]MDW5598422.1 mandelate racemase/muconate lactonizing enzyme family protein [Conexibacter stalactiti]MEC5039064.1 mandelate racemase/muconate lactonizing enzyme family protein [Conexibacter stalactiti]
MSRIAAIEARTVLCPLPQPLRLASRTVNARAFTLVRVHDDDGAVGSGFTFAGYRNSDLATRAVALLAPIALGRPVDATAGLWEAMAHATLLEGRAGAAMRALSAIDVALWDLRGRRAGLPLQRLLGAVELESVPGYLAGGYFTDGGEAALLAEVDEQLAAGATTVKVKIGAGSAADDVARVRAVRQRVGDAVALIADANGRWRSVAEALPVARALARLDLRYLEDPFPPQLVHLHRELFAASGLPLAAGEVLSHPGELRALAAGGGVGVLVVDATACGGVTGFQRIAAYAALEGVGLHTHWFSELHAPLAATVAGDTLVEHFGDDRAMPFARLVEGGPRWERGRLLLSDAPGHGLAFDEPAVERFAIEPWERLQ